jgi:hypothetical protein
MEGSHADGSLSNRLDGDTGLASARTSGRTGASERSRRSARPRGAFAVRNLTGIEKRGRGGGYPASAGRRRHRDKATESEEADAIPDLLLKHPRTTLAITLTKTHENT